MKRVLRKSVLDERAGVGDAVKGGMNRHPALRGEFLLSVVREKHTRSATVSGNDFGGEFVFLHGSSFCHGVGLEAIWTANSCAANKLLVHRLGDGAREEDLPIAFVAN